MIGETVAKLILDRLNDMAIDHHVVNAGFRTIQRESA